MASMASVANVANMANMANSANSASTTNTALERSAHPLRDSFIYDSGADGHICNDINRFDQSTLRWLESPQPWLGVASTIETLAYGTVSIYPELANSQQKGQFHLYNCAYAPLSTISLVSAKRLRKVGIVWSTNSDTVEYKGTELFKLTEAYGQYLLEYQEASTASFVATRPLIKPVDARTWHLRMGHLGPEALERLVEATTNAKIQAPHTIDCERTAPGPRRRIWSTRDHAGWHPGHSTGYTLTCSSTTCHTTA